MGRLITFSGGDEPVNEGERRVVAALVQRLPDDYIIMPNAELEEPGHQTYEYDVIVIAPHAVYAIEIKDWHGDLLADPYEWLLNGQTRKSPLRLIRQKARVLKSNLINAVPALAQVWVEGVVCLASKPTTLRISPEIQRQVFLLDDLIPSLLDASAVQKLPQAIATLQNTIAQALGARLRARSHMLRFRSYEVIETIEHDGDETFYRARRYDMPAAPEVRLRVVTLSPYLLTPHQLDERRNALMRDAAALQKMGTHPNIVAARDAFEDEAGHFVLVLDAAEGRSLRQRLLNGTPMTIEERLDTLIAVCRALVHAHSHGVIHRHVAPTTTLIGTDDIVRLSDFSLAKLLSPGVATVWHAESIADMDPRYMAPEISQSTFGPATPATDLYALGCVAFELFAGQPPFANATEAFGPTPEMPGDAPERLRDLCAAMLKGDPLLRLSDTKAALAVLESLRGSDGAPRVTGPKSEYVEGDIIDSQFEVRAVLGRGGFANVYRAYRAIDDREYAVKVFPPSVDFDKVQREITILQDINHPHIVKSVWAARTQVGQWYLVTQLVEGETLTDYAKGKKRLAPDEAVEIICQLLEALEAIHPNHRRIAELRRRKEEGDISMEEYYELQQLETEGIVHRDIKPQNLILSDHGIVLIDFNIASRVGQQVLTTSGTPPYQCPDIQAGLDRWNPTSDLFAVGVTLYELLCYVHPYEDAQPRVDRDPRDPRGYRPDLAPDLAAFLMKACAPWSDQRFTTATEMREAMRAISPLIITHAKAGIGVLSERLKQLITAAPPNVNPMVDEFLSLSSQARRSNRGTRGMDEIAAATYVQTQLDTKLTDAVLQGRHRLVIVTGNAGDGKTAFIQQVEAQAESQGAIRAKTPNGSTLQHGTRNLITLYDGSQDEGGRSSDEVLRSFFQPFTVGAQPDGVTRLAAINEGRLRDFLLTHRAEFGPFATYVIGALDNPMDAQQGFDTVVVNLNARSVTVGGEHSIFSRQLQAIVNGPFWGPCQTCAYAARCPLKHNVDTFRDSTSGSAVTERIRVLIDLVRLRRQRHLTMRDVRSLISHILFRDRTCAEIAAILNVNDPFASLDLAYFQGPGGVGVSGDTSLERGAALLQEVDVALVANPEEDRRIAHGREPRRMSFPDRSSDEPLALIEKAHKQAGIGYGSNPQQALRAHQAARRLVFFERADDGWWSMLPYQRLREFTQALNGGDAALERSTTAETEARNQLLDEVVCALSMYEGITDIEQAGRALWLATTDQAVGDYRSYRRFARDEFMLQVAPVAAPYIETESDRLQLIHKPSQVTLDLDIDLLEVLDRLREGFVPAADADRGFLVNILLFKHQLLAQPTKELLLASDEGFVRIAIGATHGSVALMEKIEGHA